MNMLKSILLVTVFICYIAVAIKAKSDHPSHRRPSTAELNERTAHWDAHIASQNADGEIIQDIDMDTDSGSEQTSGTGSSSSRVSGHSSQHGAGGSGSLDSIHVEEPTISHQQESFSTTEMFPDTIYPESSTSSVYTFNPKSSPSATSDFSAPKNSFSTVPSVPGSDSSVSNSVATHTSGSSSVSDEASDVSSQILSTGHLLDDLVADYIANPHDTEIRRQITRVLDTMGDQLDAVHIKRQLREVIIPPEVVSLDELRTFGEDLTCPIRRIRSEPALSRVSQSKKDRFSGELVDHQELGDSSSSIVSDSGSSISPLRNSIHTAHTIESGSSLPSNRLTGSNSEIKSLAATMCSHDTRGSSASCVSRVTDLIGPHLTTVNFLGALAISGAASIVAAATVIIGFNDMNNYAWTAMAGGAVLDATAASCLYNKLLDAPEDGTDVVYDDFSRDGTIGSGVDTVYDVEAQRSSDEKSSIMGHAVSKDIEHKYREPDSDDESSSRSSGLQKAHDIESQVVFEDDDASATTGGNTFNLPNVELRSFHQRMAAPDSDDDSPLSELAQVDGPRYEVKSPDMDLDALTNAFV